MQIDEDDQGSREIMVQHRGNMPDFMQCDQFEGALHTTSTLALSDFSFCDNTFDIDLMMAPPMAIDNFGAFFGNPFPPNPHAGIDSSFPQPFIRLQLCPRGHDHPPWPRKGLLEVQKCERRCQFCGLELGSAAGLRKHVHDHRKKEGLDIEIVRGSSGRQRRSLLSNHDPNTPNQQLGSPITPTPTPYPSRPGSNTQITTIKTPAPPPLFKSASDATADPKDLASALILIDSLRRENARLKEERESLKTKVVNLLGRNQHQHQHQQQYEDSNRDRQRRMKEQLRDWLGRRTAPTEAAAGGVYDVFDIGVCVRARKLVWRTGGRIPPDGLCQKGDSIIGWV